MKKIIFATLALEIWVGSFSQEPVPADTLIPKHPPRDPQTESVPKIEGAIIDTINTKEKNKIAVPRKEADTMQQPKKKPPEQHK